MTMMMSIGYV